MVHSRGPEWPDLSRNRRATSPINKNLPLKFPSSKWPAQATCVRAGAPTCRFNNAPPKPPSRLWTTLHPPPLPCVPIHLLFTLPLGSDSVSLSLYNMDISPKISLSSLSLHHNISLISSLSLIISLMCLFYHNIVLTDG